MESEPPGAATLPGRTTHIQSNPLKQEPDHSLQVITSQNWTRPPDHLPDQDCQLRQSQDQPDHPCD
jgi:hypothetical protein